MRMPRITRGFIARTLPGAALVILLAATGASTSPEEDGEVRDRIACLQNSFDEGQLHAGAWYYGWLGFYSGYAAYDGWKAFSTKEHRAGNAVGSAKCVLAVTSLLASPFIARSAGNEYREVPEGSPEERAAKLAAGESLLERIRVQEARGRSTGRLLASLAIQLLGGGIVWYFEGFGRGLRSSVVGSAVTGLNMATQPAGGTAYDAEYRRRFGGTGDGQDAEYFFTLLPCGFAAGVRF
jgi:hypothetical protein